MFGRPLGLLERGGDLTERFRGLGAGAGVHVDEEDGQRLHAARVRDRAERARHPAIALARGDAVPAAAAQGVDGPGRTVANGGGGASQTRQVEPPGALRRLAGLFEERQGSIGGRPGDVRYGRVPGRPERHHRPRIRARGGSHDVAGEGQEGPL